MVSIYQQTRYAVEAGGVYRMQGSDSLQRNRAVGILSYSTILDWSPEVWNGVTLQSFAKDEHTAAYYSMGTTRGCFHGVLCSQGGEMIV